MTDAVVHLAPGIRIAVRRSVDADAALILSSWKRTLLRSDDIRDMRGDDAYRLLNRRCDRLFESHGAVVACHADVPSEIIGWACIERDRNVCHFVHVGKLFRRMGVARLLLGSLHVPVNATSWVPVCESLQVHGMLHYCPSMR